MDVLFKKGNAIGVYPVKLIHLDSESDFKFAAQVMFVVPKRNFKKAHDRNKLKRRMKEVYRKSKGAFYAELGDKKKLIAFIYYSKKAENYSVIEKAIQSHLKKMS